MDDLLQLLHDGLVEHKADDGGDAHDQEEDGADDVHYQVDGEVSHLRDSWQGPAWMTVSADGLLQTDILKRHGSICSVYTVCICCF